MRNVGLLAQIAIERMKYGHHVSEVYSPPRVNVSAGKIGLVPGMSLDLTELDPHDGLPWDFTKVEKRVRARNRVKEDRPFLLIGCPPCTAYSPLFSWNKAMGTMGTEHTARTEAEGRVHLQFCAELYQMQLDAGRFFLHEHPKNATSWK